jgi:hypothetical protein
MLIIMASRGHIQVPKVHIHGFRHFPGLNSHILNFDLITINLIKVSYVNYNGF